VGRPSKTFDVICGEKKSHRTKSELEKRKKAEKSVLTGEKMREFETVKSNDSAHKHFTRVRKLMALIGRDDAMHEQVINRYCMMLAEADELRSELERIAKKRDDLQKAYDNGEIRSEYYTDADCSMVNLSIKVNDALEKKRGMLFQIEKENLMTVASGLRAVPKKAVEEEEDPMLQMMQRVQMR